MLGLEKIQDKFDMFENYYLPVFYAELITEDDKNFLVYKKVNEKFEELVFISKEKLLNQPIYIIKENEWDVALNWEEVIKDIECNEYKIFQHYFERFQKFMRVYIYADSPELFLISFEDITYEKQFRRILIEKNRQIDYLSSELQNKSDIDIATGVYNYQFAVENINECITLFEEDGADFALVFFNIMDFSNINAKYGYEFGDSLLREFANVLIDVTRKIDVVCRMYADKFLVIYNNCDIDIARIMIKKVVIELERKMKFPNGDVVNINGSIIDYDTGDANTLISKLEDKANENKKLGLNIIM